MELEYIFDKHYKNGCVGCNSLDFGLWYLWKCCDLCFKRFKTFKKFKHYALLNKNIKIVEV